MASNGLYRSKDDRILAGVCGGFAKSMTTNAWLIRILFILITAALAGIGGVVLYILAWLLMKEEPEEISSTQNRQAEPMKERTAPVKGQAIPFKSAKKDDDTSTLKPKDGAGIR